MAIPHKVANWVIVASVIIAVLMLIFGGARSIISLALGFICAKICSDWAIKTKKNPNSAWAIGLLFGFIGLIAYWLYYRKDIAKAKRKK